MSKKGFLAYLQRPHPDEMGVLVTNGKAQLYGPTEKEQEACTCRLCRVVPLVL